MRGTIRWNVPGSILTAMAVGLMLWVSGFFLACNAQEVRGYSGMAEDGTAHHFACFAEQARCSYAIVTNEGEPSEESDIGAGVLVVAQPETEDNWPIVCITADWTAEGDGHLMGQTACFVWNREADTMTSPYVTMNRNPALEEFLAEQIRKLQNSEKGVWGT